MFMCKLECSYYFLEDVDNIVHTFWFHLNVHAYTRMFILFSRKCEQYCPCLNNNCPHFLGSLECSCVNSNVHTIFQKVWTILSILKYNCPHFLGSLECSCVDSNVHTIFQKVWTLLSIISRFCPHFLEICMNI
jgi:hypothetical protein